MRTGDGVNFALKTLGLAGLTATVIIAPNATQAIGKLLKKSSVKEPDYQKILRELTRQKLIIVSHHGDEIHLNLTPAGAQRLQNTMIDELSIPRPAIWDKRWRVVTFDIPVKMSKQRQQLTLHLRRLGFQMLQRSMWVHPFPCFETVDQVAGHFNVLRFCSYMEVARFDSLTANKLTSLFKDDIR